MEEEEEDGEEDEEEEEEKEEKEQEEQEEEEEVSTVYPNILVVCPCVNHTLNVCMSCVQFTLLTASLKWRSV